MLSADHQQKCNLLIDLSRGTTKGVMQNAICNANVGLCQG